MVSADNKEVIFLRIEPELKRRVQDLARAERRSVTAFILLLLERKAAGGVMQ